MPIGIVLEGLGMPMTDQELPRLQILNVSAADQTTGKSGLLLAVATACSQLSKDLMEARTARIRKTSSIPSGELT